MKTARECEPRENAAKARECAGFLFCEVFANRVYEQDRIYWLGKVRVHSRVHALLNVFHEGVCGERDNRNALRVFAF